MENLELYKKMMRIAVEKGQDIDFVNTTMMKKEFEFVDLKEFRGLKKVLIIGLANMSNVIEIIDNCTEETEFILLEDDEKYIDLFHEELKKSNKNIKIQLCNLEHLALDKQALDHLVKEITIESAEQFFELMKKIKKLKINNPFIEYESLDAVYINLYNRYEKKVGIKLLEQSFSLLKEGGKIIVNVVLSDEMINKNVGSLYQTINVQNIPKESEIFQTFENLGYLASTYIWKGEIPVKIINRVELRPYVIHSMKGIQGICKEKGHAIFYNGPWKQVVDDDGHILKRGQRTAVCEKTYKNLTSEYYKNETIGIEPYDKISEEEAMVFDCTISPVRDPMVTKGIKKLESKITEDINEIKCC